MRKLRLPLLFLALAATVTTIGLAGQQQIQAVIGNVFLQDTTPGSVQVGHASINGTFRAGQVNVSSTNAGTIPVIGNNNAAAPAQFGGSFSVAGANSTALRGTATFANGAGIGVYGESRSSSGTGVKGVATKDVSGAVGVFGSGYYGGSFVTNKPGTGAGIHAGSNATAARGLFAESNSTFTFDAPVFLTNSGTSSSITGLSAQKSGVFNSYTTDFGSVSTGDAAVVGIDRRGSGVGIGVYGKANSADGYGVQAVGSGTGANVGLSVTGNFNATGVKSFVIDHPLDPQNKTLYHYCSEGPEPFNIYRGNVTLNAKGEAWVELPDYYSEINADAVYQLTPIGGPAVLYVAVEAQNNRFKIAGGRSGMRASWVVTARRNDAYVRHYGITHEKNKSDLERGAFLSPEAYGLDRSRGMAARGEVTEYANGASVRGDGKVLTLPGGRRP